LYAYPEFVYMHLCIPYVETRVVSCCYAACCIRLGILGYCTLSE